MFVIASNSGVNGSIVEMAQHRQGARPSSDRRSRRSPRAQTWSPGIPSGSKLVRPRRRTSWTTVHRTAMPFWTCPGGGKVCAVSSITAALLAQMLAAEIVGRLAAAGETPPVYLSANIPGGDEHNHAVEQTVRRSDPAHRVTGLRDRHPKETDLNERPSQHILPPGLPAACGPGCDGRRRQVPSSPAAPVVGGGEDTVSGGGADKIC
ncbi:MAG: hypothetical protein WKF83_05650 [Nocardioidaceae bacterium]